MHPVDLTIPSNFDGCPPHFMSIGLSNHGQTQVTSPLAILLPTHPLPPEQALDPNHSPTTGFEKEPVNLKIVRPENLDEAKAHKCDYCEYTSDKKDRFTRHVKIVHFKEKPFACTMCEYATGRKDKLKRHQSTVHRQERPFICNFCPHTSGRKDKLKEHMERVHFKNRPKRPRKRYPKMKKNQPAPQAEKTETESRPQELIQQPQPIFVHQQPQQILNHSQPHQIIISQGDPNGVQMLSAAGGLTMAQLPISLVPVSISADGIPTHYELKPHQFINLRG